MSIHYKVVFLYYKKGFSVQEIMMVLNLKQKQVDDIIDVEFKTMMHLEKLKFINYGSLIIEDREFEQQAEC